MNTKLIFKNASIMIFQAIISSILLIVLYKYLLIKIGIERMGIWSVVLSTVSITRICELGLNGSITKHIAKYRARNELTKASLSIQTAALSVGIVLGCVMIGTYSIFDILIIKIIPLYGRTDAQLILPYLMMSVWLIGISSVFQASLEGFQKYDIRCLILIGGHLLYISLVFFLVPKYNFIGLAYAQLFQSVFLALTSWYFLRFELRFLPYIPYKWDRIIFKEIIIYGINFQIISIARMLYDPVTKALLSTYGGLAATGYYEMASQMITKLRMLLSSGNQVIIPVTADMQEKTPEYLIGAYKKNYSLILYLSLPFYGLIASSIPLISILWLGSYQQSFVTFSLLLTVGWGFNTLTIPAFFSYLGTGRLFWNTISHIYIGLSNIILGYIFGMIYNENGVVLAWSLSLIVGSALPIIAIHKEQRIKISEYVPNSHKVLFTYTVVALIAISPFYTADFFNKRLMPSIIAPIIFCIIVARPFWKNETRFWIQNELQRLKA